jgi:hypothetical protein
MVASTTTTNTGREEEEGGEGGEEEAEEVEGAEVTLRPALRTNLLNHKNNKDRAVGPMTRVKTQRRTTRSYNRTKKNGWQRN